MKDVNDDVAQFNELLGLKLTSIMIDDECGICDLGFENGIHLELYVGEGLDHERIEGEIVHVS